MGVCRVSQISVVVAPGGRRIRTTRHVSSTPPVLPGGGVDRSWTVHGAMEDRVWIDGERSSDEGKEAIR